MNKFILIIILMIVLSASFTYAHCPLCTAAVGAAAVSAKYYGLDTTIIGLLIGAFGVSTGLWIGLKIKKQYFRLQLPIITILSFLLTIVPLMYIDKDSIYLPMLFFGQAGSSFNKVYWVNKILFGSIIGAASTSLAYLLHIYIKRIRGKVLFPFQGIVFTLLSLAAIGSIMYFSLGA